MLFWVVDAGGTKTHGVLANAEGRIYANETGGPCNLSMLGAQGCQAALSEVLNAACSVAKVKPADITHAFLALGGLDTEGDRADLSAVLANIFHGTNTRWQLENDVLAALYSGTMGEPGVVLLAGTGSMALGLDDQGQVHRSGGWGHLISGDPGSAYDVGHRVLVYLLNRYDTGEKPDLLGKMVMSACQVTTLPGLVDWVEICESPATRTAQLARIADKAATDGHIPSHEILTDAAAAMVAHLDVLMPHLVIAQRPIPVVLAGGMFRSQIYTQTVQRLLMEVGKNWKPIVPTMPPVGGSYIGALRLAGCKVTEEVVNHFTAQL